MLDLRFNALTGTVYDPLVDIEDVRLEGNQLVYVLGPWCAVSFVSLCCCHSACAVCACAVCACAVCACCSNEDGDPWVDDATAQESSAAADGMLLQATPSKMNLTPPLPQALATQADGPTTPLKSGLSAEASTDSTESGGDNPRDDIDDAQPAERLATRQARTYSELLAPYAAPAPTPQRNATRAALVATPDAPAGRNARAATVGGGGARRMSYAEEMYTKFYAQQQQQQAAPGGGGL